MQPRDKFRNETFFCILDSLEAELKKRISSYKYLHDLFGFLTDFESMSSVDLRRHAEMLVESYNTDLEASFVDEFIQFVSIMEGEQDKSIRHMSELLKVDGGLFRASFPNVEIAIRIYLTIPVNNCEGERSFSTLSRVKNHLRATMSQQRLDALSVMCIEAEFVRKLDFNELINEFAESKTRRRSL